MKKRKGLTLLELVIAMGLTAILLLGISRSQIRYSASLARAASTGAFYDIDACIFQLTLDMKSAEEIDVISSALLYISSSSETIIYELTDGVLYRDGISIITVESGSFTGKDNAVELQMSVKSFPPINLYFSII